MRCPSPVLEYGLLIILHPWQNITATYIQAVIRRSKLGQKKKRALTHQTTGLQLLPWLAEIGEAVVSEITGKQQKVGIILLWYCSNFNHRFFTASSFGSENKANSLSQHRTQQIHDITLSTQMSYSVWGMFLFLVFTQNVGGHCACINLWRINFAEMGFEIKTTHFSDSESTLSLETITLFMMHFQLYKLCRVFTFTYVSYIHTAWKIIFKNP